MSQEIFFYPYAVYDFDVAWAAAPEAMADFAFEPMAVPMGPQPRNGPLIMEKKIGV